MRPKPTHRPLEPEDLAALHALLDCPEVNRWSQRGPHEPLPPLLGNGRWLGSWQGEQLVAVAHLVANGPERRRHTTLLTWTCHPEWREAGANLLRAALHQAHMWMHSLRIETVVHADDQISIDLFTGLGFERELVARQAVWRDGLLVDTCVLARLLPDCPLPAPGPAPPAPPRRPAMNVSLRPLRPDDAPQIADLHNTVSVCWGTLQVPWGSVAFWRDRLRGNHERLLMLGAECGEHIAGSGVLHGNTNPREQHVWRLGMAVDVAFQGAGVGTALLVGLLQAADAYLAAHRVELEVYEDNPRAVALYKRHGFVIEGRRRAESWRAGGYADTLAMARLVPTR